MIIVEMVSWQKGTFTLDVDCIDINDEYRYIPENLQQDLNFDTQMVLLDALRIYDEKRAAGLKPADFSVANEAHGRTIRLILCQEKLQKFSSFTNSDR